MTAPVHIRQPEVVGQIRELAALTGESITKVVGDLVKSELERRSRLASLEDRRRLVNEIIESVRLLPRTGDELTDEDLYGEDGLPR